MLLYDTIHQSWRGCSGYRRLTSDQTMWTPGGQAREDFLTRIRAAVIAQDSIPGGSDFDVDFVISRLPAFFSYTSLISYLGRIDSTLWNG